MRPVPCGLARSAAKGLHGSIFTNFREKLAAQAEGFSSAGRGGPARTPEEAARVAASLGGPFVVKIQAWTTGWAAMGGVAFGTLADEAKEIAARLLAMKVGNFPVEHVLVEEAGDQARSLFGVAFDRRSERW